MDSRRKFLSRVAGDAAIATALSASRVYGANEKIRIGVIGVGARGTELLPTMKDENAEFTAFADVFTERLDAARARYPRAATYQDYRELLADRSVDAVIVATPQHLHCEHFVAALAAGKHVYQEKTMAFTVAHAKRMRAARRNAPHLTVQVGHQDCSSGHVADAKAFAESGALGAVTEIHSHMYRNTPHGKAQWARPVTPSMTSDHIAWKSFLGDARSRPFDPQRYLNWRFFWDYSGGNFYENMCHQLCFWYKVLGLGVPTRVSASGGVFLWKDGREVPDTMCAALVHDERLLFTWDSAFGNDELGITESVLGTDGTLVRAADVRYLPQKVNRPDAAEAVGRSRDRGQRHVIGLHLQNFLDCIRTSRETNCPFDLGFRVSVACRMAVDSFRQARTLRWDPKTEEIRA